MKKNNIFFLIEARISSTRLPGKVLKKVYKNHCVIDYVIKNILKAGISKENIILAIPKNKKNNKISSYVKKKYFIKIFKGSEEKLRSGDVSNTEWYLGDLPTDVDGGKVNRILQTIDGTIPKSTRWIEVDRKTSNMDANLRNEAVIFYKPNNHGSTWVWSTKDRPPQWREYFVNRNTN